jgi:ABC-type branched-subunit amino acid transport system substrate-binding protein
MYVGTYGVPNSELPARGRRFLSEFAKAHSGRQGPDLSAAYGAQAAEILLDAIARSDGTRESVTRELRRTNVENGILGRISFDRYGDLVAAPLTIPRITSTGVVVDRMITVPRSLTPWRTDLSGRLVGCVKPVAALQRAFCPLARD